MAIELPNRYGGGWGGGLKGAADREQDPDLVVRKFVYLICVFAPCFSPDAKLCITPSRC